MAFVSDLSYFLPERIVSNQDLAAQNPDWNMENVARKTGIQSRRIAAEDETASDLAFAAAERIFSAGAVRREEIDYLLFCTQSPDYLLPASACILQDRLRLPVRIGAFDFNQGCSGYIYGIQLADALARAGAANKVLLLTGETYSKYIHPRDRSVRVLFGDAATATIICARGSGAKIVATEVGTDGSGHQNLIVPAGAARKPASPETCQRVEDANGNCRTAENLYMDGQELFAFTLKRVPQVVERLLQKTGLALEEVDSFIFHQANAFMNQHLRTKMKLPEEKVPLAMEDIGNTVSNTIPVALARVGERFAPGDKIVLVGFGVGYSWGACLIEWGGVHISA